MLNNIFYNYLVNEKHINPKNIIKFAFDNEEDILKLDKYDKDRKSLKKIGRQVLIDSQKFLTFIHEQSKDNGHYYLLLDEIQNLENFVRVLNSIYT